VGERLRDALHRPWPWAQKLVEKSLSGVAVGTALSGGPRGERLVQRRSGEPAVWSANARSMAAIRPGWASLAIFRRPFFFGRGQQLHQAEAPRCPSVRVESCRARSQKRGDVLGSTMPQLLRFDRRISPTIFLRQRVIQQPHVPFHNLIGPIHDSPPCNRLMSYPRLIRVSYCNSGSYFFRSFLICPYIQQHSAEVSF
jgi:hypothetical protein